MIESNEQLVDNTTLHKLKWRSRRGMLENDLFIKNFFERYDRQITYAMADAMATLMTLSDADLFNLLLGKQELEPEISTVEMRKLLQLLRNRA